MALILGPAFLRGSAPVELATASHAGHWVPALPWDAPRLSGFAASGSAAAASPHSGPHLFEDQCALVTPDPPSLNAIAGDQRVACLCRSALLLPLDSAQSAAADRRFRRHFADLLPRAGAPGRLRPGRLSRSSSAPERTLGLCGRKCICAKLCTSPSASAASDLCTPSYSQRTFSRNIFSINENH